MKNYTSVFMLLLRNVFYKLLALNILAIALEFILFGISFLNHNKHAGSYVDFIIDHSGMGWIFLIWLTLSLVILSLNGVQFSGQQNYTWGRLRISIKQIFIIQIFCNILFLSIIWMTQIGILLICCKAYIGWIPSDMIGEQTIFLASLRSRFFHHIMPIEQGLLWFINILFMILSSVGCAYIAFRQRLRRKL